jgi:hypothetical protein
VTDRVPPSWRPLISKGKRVSEAWRLEWTWNGDGTVALDAVQSDQTPSIPVPVESVGPGLDVALGARVAVRFPPSNRVWVPPPLFEPSPSGFEMRQPIIRDVDAGAGTLTVEFGSVESAPTLLVNPDAGARCRLTLILENQL